MKTVLLSGVLAAACGVVLAKLPPPDDAAKAKAAETAAKAAWQAKVSAYELCKVQDKIAAHYGKDGRKAPARAPNAQSAASSSGQPPPAVAAASAAKPAASGGTPVAFKPPPPCIDPGPFAYNPPEQKPLETSGAHSPSGTAATPPSVKPNSAEMGKKP